MEIIKNLISSLDIISPVIKNTSLKKNWRNIRILGVWSARVREKYKAEYEFIMSGPLTDRYNKYSAVDENDLLHLILNTKFHEAQDLLVDSYLKNQEILSRLRAYGTERGVHIEDNGSLSGLYIAIKEEPNSFLEEFGSFILKRVIEDYHKEEKREISELCNECGLITLTHDTPRETSLLQIYKTGVLTPNFELIPTFAMISRGMRTWHFDGWKKEFNHPYAELLGGNPISEEVNRVFKETIKKLFTLNLTGLVKMNSHQLFEKRYRLYTIAPKYKTIMSTVKVLSTPWKHFVWAFYGPLYLAPKEARLTDEEIFYFIPNVLRNDKIANNPYLIVLILLAVFLLLLLIFMSL